MNIVKSVKLKKSHHTRTLMNYSAFSVSLLAAATLATVMVSIVVAQAPITTKVIDAKNVMPPFSWPSLA